MTIKKQSLLLVFFCIYFFMKDTQAQSINVTPKSTKVWAGETVEYTRSSATDCSDYNWTAFLGVFPDFQDAQSIVTPASKVKVKWNMTNLPSAAIDVSCGAGLMALYRT